MMAKQYNCPNAQEVYETAYYEALFDGTLTYEGANHCPECAQAQREGSDDGLAVLYLRTKEYVELLNLQQLMRDRLRSGYRRPEQKIVFYIISIIDREIGRPMRIDFLRWLFERDEIQSSHLDRADGLREDEAAALILWANPYKAPGIGSRWELLNRDFNSILNRWLKVIAGQIDMFEADRDVNKK